MIKAVFFDFGGTLVDNSINNEVYPAIEKIIGKENKEHWDKLELDWHSRYMSERYVFTALAKKSGISKKYILEMIKVWNQKLKHEKLFPDSLEILKLVRKKGLKTCLISNAPPISKKIFRKLGLTKYFDEIIFSYEVNTIKPEDEIYRIALSKLKISPEKILFVGDTYDADYQKPKKLGMNAILIDRTKKRKGAIHSLNELKRILSV